MSPSIACCKLASTTVPVRVADDPFSQMIVLDYYDGPAGGFLRCKACGADFHFYMLDWDDMHAVRVFALAAIADSSVRRLLVSFEGQPDRKVWIPPLLSRASEDEIAEFYDREIQEVIDTAAAPSVVIAWSVAEERTLAMRGIDSTAALHLSSWFERQPHPIVFDWFEYLRVARQLQPV